MTTLNDTVDLWMPGQPGRIPLVHSVNGPLTQNETNALRQAASERWVRTLTDDPRPLDERDDDFASIADAHAVPVARLAELLAATTTKTTDASPADPAPSRPRVSHLSLVR